MLLENIKRMLPQGLKKGIKRLLGVRDDRMNDLDMCYDYPFISKQKINFYGQYGEDAKLWQLFRGKAKGYFVEVGAMEGVRFSNTYLFERAGWRGICIEPHPDYIGLLRKNRPSSVVIQAAVGNEDKEEVDFFMSHRGSMSTLDKSLEKFFRSHYKPWFRGFEEIKVSLITLNTLLKKNNAPIPIDILSIDVEGTERDVLEGFDIKKYSPRVVIVEIAIRREPVEEYMKKSGYVLACTSPSNAIYCRDESDAEIICRTRIVGEQSSPAHPLD